MSAFEHTRKRLIDSGHDPKEVELLGSEIADSVNTPNTEGLFEAFEIESDKLPWPQDHDFGALVLQLEAKNTNSEVAKIMLSKAIKRAHWCTTCATSGGEALARAVHLKELENELSRYS